MITKEDVLNIMREKGQQDALDLRNESKQLSDTEIMAEEIKVPQWDPNKDYSLWPSNSPIAFNGQMYRLLQPHNASHYPNSNPETERSLWGLMHSMDPRYAKPYVAPLGTSGLYYKGEFCTDPLAEDPTAVYQCIVEQTNFRPSEWPQGWKEFSEET